MAKRSQHFRYGYDDAGNLKSVEERDANSAMLSQVSFRYDLRHNVDFERIINPVLDENLAIWREYNDRGLVKQTDVVTWSSGIEPEFTNHYEYDSRNQLKEISQEFPTPSESEKAVTFDYNGAGQLAGIYRYSSLDASPSSPDLVAHSKYSYDGTGRIESIAHSREKVNAAHSWDGTADLPNTLDEGAMIAGYFMEYDQGNRLVGLSSYRDGFKASYSYDNRDQLEQASYTTLTGITSQHQDFLPTLEDYSFDATGNREVNGASISLPGSHNRVTGTDENAFTYEYDEEGNQTDRSDGSTYEFDHRNRLDKVTKPDGTVVDFTYDPFDRLIGKQVFDASGTLTYTDARFWDGYQLALRFQSVNTLGGGSQDPVLTNRYLYGDMVDMLLAEDHLPQGAQQMGAGPETYWPLHDHLGSVRDIIDSNGVVREHNVYDSFGNLIFEDDFNAFGERINSDLETAIDSLFGYTGREFDEDVGLQYNRARWYDATQGRWISQDPIGFAGGDENLYGYVGNSSQNFTDPTGLWGEGHHWVPVNVGVSLFNEGIISDDELFYFTGRRSGDLVDTHNYATEYGGVTHPQYDAEVKRQLKLWKKSKISHQFPMEKVADNIRDGKCWNGSPNPTLSKFNNGIKKAMVPLAPGKLNKMDGEGDTRAKVISKGRTSFKKRGYEMVMIGAFSHFLASQAALANGTEAGKILSG
ncbi:MAG: RHS repeat-associated core domain-containing protein, partial [Planctomycetota bacterium]